MIASLRRKFIFITMASLAVVLLVLMGFVNLANYHALDREAAQTISFLSENGGFFPKHPETQAMAKRNNALLKFSMSPEAPYETRFFTVELTASGDIKEVNTGSIAAISTSEATELAQELLEDGEMHGYHDNYKFQARETETGGFCYVFLDCTRQLRSFRRFLLISFLTSLGGMAAVFLLVMFFSRRAVRPVAESYEKQKQFITNAGHEIRTPLTIIDSCTEVLELEQGANEWTGSIRNQIRRLSGLTENLVALSRMDEQEQSLPMVDFSLSDAVAEAAAPFQTVAESKGRALVLEVQQGLSYHGSETSIRQLVGILCDNAVKYSLPGTVISLSLRKQGRAPVLTCINEADDLQKGDLDVFFDRFYRADPSRGGDIGGYGIGLSMARSIVSAHHGRISAASHDGRTVVITATL